MRRPATVASLLAAAFMLLQVAWVTAVPPFRGIDEFDHAYRAAAVAHGQLVPSDTPVEHGRGDYLEVPRSIVEAAQPVCSAYDYTGWANCNAVADAGGGYVRVASGAARYNPAFYWVIGNPFEHLEGTANVYALRLLASLLCAALFWVAAYSLALGARTAWPLLGLAVAVTPVFLYSSSLGAPNGVEMTAGLALWCCLLALRSDALSPRQERSLLTAAVAAAVVLALPRLLGPAWLALILAAGGCCLGRRRIQALARTHLPLLVAGSVITAASVASAYAWYRVAAPNSLAREADLGLDDPLTGALSQLPAWILQSIAAFPARNEPAPTAVYAAAGLAASVVLVAAGWRLSRRWWAVLAGLVALWLGVQLAITVATYSHLGQVWQGRYALPFAVGIPVALTVLSESARGRPPHRLVVGAVVLMVPLAHATSLVDVLLKEAKTSPLAGSPEWFTVPAWALVALVGAAVALCWSAGRVALGGAAQPPPVREAVELEGSRR